MAMSPMIVALFGLMLGVGANELEEIKSEIRNLKHQVTDLQGENAVLKSMINRDDGFGRIKRAASQEIGFTARTTTQMQVNNVVLKYGTVWYNGGNGLAQSTGYFTAPVSGMYGFHLSVHKADGTSRTYCYIMVDGLHVALAYAYQGDSQDHTEANKFTTGSAFIVYHLNAGARVAAGNCNGDIYFETTFSGFLIAQTA